MATDGGVAPSIAERTAHAFAVKVKRDGARRSTGGKLVEDAPHDLCLALVDAALATHRLAGGVVALHHVVAIAEPPPALPASTRPCMPRRVLSARSLRKSAFIVPLRPTCRCVISPFGQGDDLHAGERHALEHTCDVLLVASDAIECLR